MSVFILRPGTDEKAEWTEQPAGSAFPLLAEEVLETDTPDTADNYVETTTASLISRHGMVAQQVGGSESVTQVEGWAYLRAGSGGTGVAVDLRWNTHVIATATVAAGTGFGWVSRVWNPGGATFPYAPVMSNLAALNIALQQVGTVTSSTSRVAAVFIRVITASVVHPSRMPMGA